MLDIGDIIVVKSPTLIGRIIRWATKSWANHVCVYIGDGWVFEARPGGARPISLNYYIKKGYKIRAYRFIAPNVTILTFVELLLRKKGMGYDYGQVISLFIKTIFNINLKAENNNLAICSEIVYEAARDAGLPLPHTPQALVTPTDYERWPFLQQIF